MKIFEIEKVEPASSRSAVRPVLVVIGLSAVIYAALSRFSTAPSSEEMLGWFLVLSVMVGIGTALKRYWDSRRNRGA